MSEPATQIARELNEMAELEESFSDDAMFEDDEDL